MPTASSLAWKTSLRKSQDAVALQQIKERGALPLWRSWWYPSAIDRCSNIWASPSWALVMVSSARYWQPDCKIKGAGRNGQRDWCMSRVTAIISALLSASSSACHGLLIITVITPLPTKPSATKMPENWSWRTRQLLTCRCVSVMLLRSMQNTSVELADAKAEKMMLCVMMLPLYYCRLHIKAVCQSCVLIRFRRIMQPPRLADTAERDYFTLRERLITMQKQLEGTQKYINEQCR